MVSGYKNALCSTAELYEFVFMTVLKQSLIEPYCQDFLWMLNILFTKVRLYNTCTCKDTSKPLGD